jgi:hypothetical protein
VPDRGDGCNSDCYCIGGGKIHCLTDMGCGTFKGCIRNNVLIPHGTVCPSDDSCNKCDCFDGKILCTNKECADPNANCEPGKYCQNSSQCGENGDCLGWQLGWA